MKNRLLEKLSNSFETLRQSEKDPQTVKLFVSVTELLIMPLV